MKNQYAVFMGLGFELVILIVIFMAIGEAFDKKMQFDNIGRLVGIISGFALWMVHLFVLLKKTDQTASDNAEQK